MRLSALSSIQRILMASAVVCSLASLPAQAQPDPPAQAGRISYITGNVSFQPVGSQDWGQAEPNDPIGPGDRIFTDADGRAEIQVGQTFVRIGPNSDVSMVDSTEEGIYFGVAQGSIHLHSGGMWQGQSVYINTPNGTSALANRGDLHVDVLPEENVAIFSDYGGYNMISGAGGYEQPLTDGYSLELIGTNPVNAQWMQPTGWDTLDRWSHDRDVQIEQAQSYRYISRDVPGAYEMDAAGDWQPDTPYGAVWFPRGVDAGWAPYHNGHWVNHAPWGWVWVEDESWGYAPFHYGRWVSYQGRWGWVPGPPAAHPVWSPALVVFAGGVNFGGSAVSAWFPLGPGEAYRPTYPCSPRYVENVNRTNITVTNIVHVQNTYVNVTNVTYVNRTIGVTAMRHEDFAAGRPARQAAVKVDVHQLEHVQPLATPVVKPTAQSFIGRPAARPVPVAAARPVLINAKGMAVTATPNAKPAPPPVKAAPPVRAIAGHTVVAPPANAVKPPAAGGAPARAGAPPPPPPPAKPGNLPVTPETKTATEPAKAIVPAKTVAEPGAKAPPTPTPPAKPGNVPLKPETKTATEPNRPVVPGKAVAEPAIRTPPPPAIKPASPAATKPVTPEPGAKTAPPAKTTVVPPGKPITPEVRKPGTLPPEKKDEKGKNGKEKKDLKDKDDKDKQ